VAISDTLRPTNRPADAGRLSRRLLVFGSAAVLLALLVALSFVRPAAAAVGVTAATGGTGLSADIAANGSAPAYTTLGDIVITEVANGDFAVGTGVTMILSPPANWEFNAGVGSVAVQSGRNLTGVSVNVTSTAVTVTYTSGGTNKADVMTISGIAVRATTGLGLPGGNITRSGGTGAITGIVNGSTNFGTLSQVAGPASKLKVTAVPASATAGTSFSVTTRSTDSVGNFVNVVANTGYSLSPSGAGTLSGNTGQINAGTSTSTLAAVQYTKAESLTLTATRTSGDTLAASAASSAITINPATASKLTITSVPGSATAGSSF
jgi:hypothetical protein